MSLSPVTRRSLPKPPFGGSPVRSFRGRGLAVALVALALTSALALGSCAPKGIENVDRQKLFTLAYGRLEDEIDLFDLDQSSQGPDSQIFMKDGMFYISNSGPGKIIQLTSFGDLLAVYYNPDRNPVPSFADSGSSNPAATRKAVPYPFNHPVYLSVDERKQLYVVDRVPEERYEFDADEQVMLRDVVLRFGAEGRFLDYIGQEGPGGTPFPPVDGVYNTSKNELVVVTKSQSGITVFWFDPEGNLLFRVPVMYRNLPDPYDPGVEYLASLEKVVPDPDDRMLYLKIDYFKRLIDTETGSDAGMSFDRSCLYPLSATKGTYEDRLELSAYTGTDRDTLGTQDYKKPFEFVGITSGGWIFLSSPIPEGYAFQILDRRSRRIYSRTLTVRKDELSYNALSLSRDGILSALLANDYDASVVWWRTDEVVGDIR